MVVLKPNIVRGGRAIGLGNNLYLMKGRTHAKGGIDIGKNPKTGLEVENNEVMQVSPKGIRVFSAQPILGGISPAQYILGGANPNQVFNAQEEWKKVNKINDDGTKYRRGGKIDKKKFKTILTNDNEKEFLNWYKNVSAVLDLNKNPDDPNHHYDYRGYWLANKNKNIDFTVKDFHFPDTYKQPTHPTFSNESQYARRKYGINPKEVGHWEGENFIPGIFNDVIGFKYKTNLEKQREYSEQEYSPSEDIINYIKGIEGFRSEWYKDGNGIDIIGYGFTGKDAKAKFANGITKEQADKYFADTLAQKVKILQRDTPNWDKLNQNQRDALLSYHYNIGEGSYRNKSPKMQQALKDEDWETVVANMDYGYNDKKNPGLKKRRDYERNLFNTPVKYKYGGRKIARDGLIKNGRQLINDLENKRIGKGVEEVMLKVFNHLPKKMKERAIEVAMRTTHNATPDYALENYYRNLKNNKNFLKNDIDYIIFNKNKPSININDGLYHLDENGFVESSSDKIKDDIIDAVSKGTKLNENIATQVNEENYGIEDSYIKRNYPNRKIQYVETNPPGVNYNQKGIKSTRIEGGSGSFRTSMPNLVIDNAGIVLEYGTRNDSTFVRGWDVYDFASNENDENSFNKRWGNNSETSNKLMNALNDNIYPLVIRTPWVYEKDIDKLFKYGGIHIKPSKRGTFTTAAKKHGMSVQGFASKVLANKGKYSSAMVKKANFARNASRWKHKEFGGDMDFNYWITKDNIYKLGGRKKALNGTDYLKLLWEENSNTPKLRFSGLNVDIPEIPTLSYPQRNNVSISNPTVKRDEIGLGISNRSQRIVNNALKNNSRLSEPPSQNTIDRNDAIRTIASNQPKINKNILGNIGNIGNLIGTGINIAGNLISYGINNRALNRMRRPSMPLPLRAENLQTRVSTAAQEAAIRENVAGQEGLISGNLASSRSRLNAVNRVRNQGTSMYNQLQDRKQNIETELINRNKLNRQQIGNQNVLQFNNWRDRVTEFDNKITDLRSENGVNLTQGIADAIAGERGYLANRENDARYRMNVFLTTIANPDAFNAMNSAEIRRLARRFGITNQQLRDLGINV